MIVSGVLSMFRASECVSGSYRKYFRKIQRYFSRFESSKGLLLWGFGGSHVHYKWSEVVSVSFRRYSGRFKGFSAGFRSVTGTTSTVSEGLRCVTGCSREFKGISDELQAFQKDFQWFLGASLPYYWPFEYFWVSSEAFQRISRCFRTIQKVSKGFLGFLGGFTSFKVNFMGILGKFQEISKAFQSMSEAVAGVSEELRDVWACDDLYKKGVLGGPQTDIKFITS